MDKQNSSKLVVKKESSLVESDAKLKKVTYEAGLDESTLLFYDIYCLVLDLFFFFFLLQFSISHKLTSRKTLYELHGGRCDWRTE
jgi:hypothetical protein